MFHALGLVAPPPLHPLGARRVALLVPKSGLLLLRAVGQSELYLALSGRVLPFDNHFVSIHTALVRVRRGHRHGNKDGRDGWRCLNAHLMVRDTSERDPEAELMVSALVPAFALTMAPPGLTDLELRPRWSAQISAAPKDVLKKLAGRFNTKVFFGADLANIDRTAVLMPGTTGDLEEGGAVRPRLACPEAAVSRRRPEKHVSRSSTTQPVGGSSRQSAVMHRYMHGSAAIDQSIELISQPGGRQGPRLRYRVTLSMESAESRRRLMEGGAPVIEKTLDPCTVRVKVGEGVSHVTSFPFPVRRGSIEIKFSKRQGFVLFTVPPLPAGESTLPFAWTDRNAHGTGRGTLPSTPAWSPCPPLASLPRLDFKAEWANSRVSLLGGAS